MDTTMSPAIVVVVLSRNSAHREMYQRFEETDEAAHRTDTSERGLRDSAGITLLKQLIKKKKKKPRPGRYAA